MGVACESCLQYAHSQIGFLYFWMMLRVLVARIWVDSNLVQKEPTMIQGQEFGAYAKLWSMYLRCLSNPCVWKICLLGLCQLIPKVAKSYLRLFWVKMFEVGSSHVLILLLNSRTYCIFTNGVRDVLLQCGVSVRLPLLVQKTFKWDWSIFLLKSDH